MPSRGASSSEKPQESLYTPDEAGYFFNALSAARQHFGHVTGAISRENSIGPRGPWMVGLIGRQAISPHELAHFFKIGRSLVTAELTQLQEAGLINYEKSPSDGRRVELSLTPRGHEVRDRLSRELGALLEERLSGYTKEQVLLTARMLNDFATSQRYEGKVPRNKGGLQAQGTTKERTTRGR